MKTNMGIADRLIRSVIAIIITALFFAGTLSGTPGVILLVVSGIFLATSVAGFCPLYSMFGISSSKK